MKLNTHMREEWKDIEGYEGLYQVSNSGQIKSLQINKILKPVLANKKAKISYYRISLCKNAKSKAYLIHRLVANAFIPNPENKPCVNHLDCITSNNKRSNLEWVNHSENVIHSIKMGRIKPLLGINNGQSKLLDKDVIEIRRLYIPRKMSRQKLADKFNVSQSTIMAITQNKGWKHLL